LTFDFEDWYQLSSEILGEVGESQGAILERQLDRLLGLLARRNTRATFFCLGKSLERSSHLVPRVAEAGHEIATHGWGHQRLYEIGLEAFREDLHRSIIWLTDLTGRPVLGYRAPAFSVAAAQLGEFYDSCLDAGLRYDSSVFPFRGRRYGIPDAPRHPHIVRTDGHRRLVEVPLATVEWAGRRWPVAGGGWWRLLPGRAIRAAVRRLNREGLPFTTYTHVYEVDSEPLDAAKVLGPRARGKRWAFRQNLGRSSIYGKLDKLLKSFRFGSVEDYLRGAGHL
jgi:polysaccharide deacetylase family protein (PEP-CTERM system associated)